CGQIQPANQNGAIRPLTTNEHGVRVDDAEYALGSFEKLDRLRRATGRIDGKEFALAVRVARHHLGAVRNQLSGHDALGCDWEGRATRERLNPRARRLPGLVSIEDEAFAVGKESRTDVRDVVLRERACFAGAR